MPGVAIALSKGRILDETLPLLARAGIVPAEDPETSRKLVLGTNRPGVSLVILRAQDVPTYVEYGAADLGVAGRDVLLEHGSEGLYQPLDLGIGRCRLVAPHDEPPFLPTGPVSHCFSTGCCSAGCWTPSDRELADSVARLGARVQSAEAFAAQLEPAEAEPSRREQPPTPAEVEQWLAIFRPKDKGKRAG